MSSKCLAGMPTISAFPYLLLFSLTLTIALALWLISPPMT
jgi:hypothetical protein